MLPWGIDVENLGSCVDVLGLTPEDLFDLEASVIDFDCREHGDPGPSELWVLTDSELVELVSHHSEGKDVRGVTLGLRRSA